MPLPPLVPLAQKAAALDPQNAAEQAGAEGEAARARRFEAAYQHPLAVLRLLIDRSGGRLLPVPTGGVRVSSGGGGRGRAHACALGVPAAALCLGLAFLKGCLALPEALCVRRSRPICPAPGCPGAAATPALEPLAKSLGDGERAAFRAQLLARCAAAPDPLFHHALYAALVQLRRGRRGLPGRAFAARLPREGSGDGSG